MEKLVGVPTNVSDLRIEHCRQDEADERKVWLPQLRREEALSNTDGDGGCDPCHTHQEPKVGFDCRFNPIRTPRSINVRHRGQVDYR